MADVGVVGVLDGSPRADHYPITLRYGSGVFAVEEAVIAA
jgi:hypothetical protein